MYNGKRVQSITKRMKRDTSRTEHQVGTDANAESRNETESETDNGYLAACLVSKCKAGKEWNGVEKEKEVQPVHLLVR